MGYWTLIHNTNEASKVSFIIYFFISAVDIMFRYDMEMTRSENVSEMAVFANSLAITFRKIKEHESAEEFSDLVGMAPSMC